MKREYFIIKFKAARLGNTFFKFLSLAYVFSELKLSHLWLAAYKKKRIQFIML